ncbi:MAG: hypothetical protein AAF514_18155, partial [Verrucomicrobiota bacterium]
MIGGRPDEPPLVPEVEGLSLRYRSHKSIPAKEGTQLAMERYFFDVLSSRKGTFVMPSGHVLIDGVATEYPSDEVTFWPGKSLPVSAKNFDRGHFILFFSKTRACRVGEALEVEIIVCLEDRFRRTIQQGTLGIDREDFILRGLEQGAGSVAEIEGRGFYTIPFTAVLSPIRAGPLVLGPARYRSRLRGSTTGAEIEVEGEGLTIEVESLPDVGRPGDFSGAMGRFQGLTVHSTKEVGKVGEAIPLAVDVEGNGNLASFKMPRLVGRDSGIWELVHHERTVYRLTDGSAQGMVRFDCLLKPLQATERFPSFSLTYFDTAKGFFQSMESEPLAISISGESIAGSEPEVFSNSPTPMVAPAIPGDILEIFTDEGEGRKFRGGIWDKPGMRLLLAVPFVGALVFALLGIARFIGAKFRNLS